MCAPWLYFKMGIKDTVGTIILKNARVYKIHKSHSLLVVLYLSLSPCTISFMKKGFWLLSWLLLTSVFSSTKNIMAPSVLFLTLMIPYREGSYKKSTSWSSFYAFRTLFYYWFWKQVLINPERITVQVNSETQKAVFCFLPLLTYAPTPDSMQHCCQL